MYGVSSFVLIRRLSRTFATFVGRFCPSDQQPKRRDQQMPLTDMKIRNAKPGENQSKFSDGGGLQLWTTPAGGKIWKLAFRFGGKHKTLTIGPYPVFSLQEARQKREEVKRHLADGRDPSSLKKLERGQITITSSP
jgi:Arm DNA-binding domain